MRSAPCGSAARTAAASARAAAAAALPSADVKVWLRVSLGWLEPEEGGAGPVRVLVPPPPPPAVAEAAQAVVAEVVASAAAAAEAPDAAADGKRARDAASAAPRWAKRPRLSAPAPGEYVSDDDGDAWAAVVEENVECAQEDGAEADEDDTAADADASFLHRFAPLLAPSESTLLALDQHSTCRALRRLIGWFTKRQEHAEAAAAAGNVQSVAALLRGGYAITPAAGAWLYALLARLEQPVLADTVAALRQLFLLARRQRVWLGAALARDAAATAAQAAGGDALAALAAAAADTHARAALATLDVLMEVAGGVFSQRAPGEE